MMEVISDQYGRRFRKLRVSLLSHCNLGCVYCVNGEEELKESNGGPGRGPGGGGLQGLNGQELLEIIRRLHGQLELETVRLTGGEPLLYSGLVELVEGIRSMGIPAIKLTTNGWLLERKAVALKQAGLQSINVSLDAVEEEVFARMSRRNGVSRVIRGIDAALRAGLAVKLNTVVMKGMNEDQVLPLLEFAFEREITIRFLEVMGMGHLYHHSDRYLSSQQEILQMVGERYELTALGREPSATARYWVTERGQRFGIIANESEPFCRDCDRLRLDSSGHIYGCLSNNRPIALGIGETAAEWGEKLRAALAQKQALRFTGSELSMLQIGG
ncbi:MAG TPA: radical SAM protein [Puia sp.]|jgi:cyclic pyranopterin phosphate synthase|nr:radical SAM protein [Puia sp.]